MCGISGYIGNTIAAPIVLESLSKLEYRGYDSAGIASVSDDKFNVCKSVGKLHNLISKSNSGAACIGNVAIGHTRWATHGVANLKNAHPHLSDRFAIVHNGIIKNSDSLRRKYLSDTQLCSDTDSEVIVQLVNLFTNNGETVVSSLCSVMNLCEGSWAIALLDRFDSNKIYVSRNKSPLIIGEGDDFKMIASDIIALSPEIKSVYEINDMEIAEITTDAINFYDISGNILKHTPKPACISDQEDYTKDNYPHFMLKEIEQQPDVIKRIINYYKTDDYFNIPPQFISSTKACDRIYIIACGTSYHAGLTGKTFFEKITHKPVCVCIASEFVYNPPIFSPNPVFIFVSQSGETADCIAAMDFAKRKGYTVYSVTNVVESTLALMSDYNFHLFAGREISVASTKAYTAQLAVFAILAYAAVADISVFYHLGCIADNMSALFDQKNHFRQIAHDYLKNASNCFYIGRGTDLYTCMEASLKLKEISYIHSEAIAAGELKHGSIALIESGTPVFAINTQKSLFYHTESNAREAQARGANVITLTTSSDIPQSIVIPRIDNEIFLPFLSIIPTQYIAYYAALQNGCDVDMPRNLAKSVTVE